MPTPFEIETGSATLRGEMDGEMGSETGGNSAALVFLHAGVTDRRMWAPQLTEFAQTHQVVAYDRRGFGETTAIDAPFRQVEDLATVLDYIGIDQATLCGCSQGARIAIDFALSHPRRTKALILVGATWSGAPWQDITPREIELVEQLESADATGNLAAVNDLEAQLWLDGPAADAGRVTGPLRDLFLDMNGTALRHPELTREIDPADAQLAKINCPALLINGDLDFEMTRQHHQTLGAQLAHSESLEMNDTAHLPSMEQPDVFNHRVRKFLTKRQ